MQPEETASGCWGIYIYSILAQKYHMYPKFAFFKKEYNHTFPFEQDL